MYNIKSNQLRTIYLLGFIAAIIVISGTLFDITIGSSIGVNLLSLPKTAVERFTQLQSNNFLGLYNLDFLNLCTTFLMLVTFFAITVAHKDTNILFAILALIIYIIGVTVFIINNAALPMLELSYRYASANDELQKTLIAAAGEALLAKGAHGSFGVLQGFIIPLIADIIISFVMFHGKVFNKINAIFGILGNILLFVYIIMVTFIPDVKSMAVIFAMPGGLMSLTWMIMIMIKLLNLSKSGEKNE